MDSLQHYSRDYKPYLPSLTKEEIPSAHRVINEMLAKSTITVNRDPSSYNKRVLQYWSDRKTALETF